MSEKQRVKRNEHRKSLNKQAVQEKVKKQKLKRKELVRVAFYDGANTVLGKLQTWFKLEFPKDHAKKWEDFKKFMGK